MLIRGDASASRRDVGRPGADRRRRAIGGRRGWCVQYGRDGHDDNNSHGDHDGYGSHGCPGGRCARRQRHRADDHGRRYWDDAVPLHVDDTGTVSGTDGTSGADSHPTTDRRLLSLLVAGVTEKAIASQLGLSRRRVQRHIQQLMTFAGATRMQLAWQAARRDWVQRGLPGAGALSAARHPAPGTYARERVTSTSAARTNATR
ncbi:hypothetical protein [Streptomyces sp. NPDC090798]|uniref:helix-turn-helix transcriptional regulator n=1 Tax=Streptomyces sp. NPDC090798 TaxID=3365968 RepID=UPI0037F228AE